MNCQVGECATGYPYYAKGYCKVHYDRLRRRGTLAPRQLAKEHQCVVSVCSSLQLAHGYCRNHYLKLRRTGTLESLLIRYENPAQRTKERVAAWKKANWLTYKAYLANRKHRVRQATPKWADKAAIRKFYEACPPGYHVDHICPLNGKNVSGLHVLENLQYLPAVENLRKGNRIGSVEKGRVAI